MSSALIDKLALIQQSLKAPKNQYNNFGKYKYRSCEDILEGLKGVLDGCIVTLQDDVVMVGDRIYIKATATIADGENTPISVSAFAREPLIKKGMDESQITGTASSYARKYALNGLFLIDDTKDADTMDNSAQQSQPSQNDDKPWYSDNDFNSAKQSMIDYINGGHSADEVINDLSQSYKINKKIREQIKGLEK